MVMDLNGCSIIVLFFVIVNFLLEFELIIEEICDMAFVYFYLLELSFEWLGGSGNELVMVIGGIYVVIVIDFLGCVLDWQVDILEFDGFEVQFFIEQFVCFGELGEVEIELYSIEWQVIFFIDGGENYIFF